MKTRIALFAGLLTAVLALTPAVADENHDHQGFQQGNSIECSIGALMDTLREQIPEISAEDILSIVDSVRDESDVATDPIATAQLIHGSSCAYGEYCSGGCLYAVRQCWNPYSPWDVWSLGCGICQ